MEQTITTEACIPKLYYRYKRKSDKEIVELLSSVVLVRKENKGIGSVYGYYQLSDEHVAKIISKPRNISLTFDATETKHEPLNLKEYKTVTFLVKSSSRFFLNPDIGEVIDQIEYDDLHDIKLKGICVNLDEYETLKGTEGEHFLMTASLLTNTQA